MQQNHKERGGTVCYEQYQTLLCSDLHSQINNKYVETQNRNQANTIYVENTKLGEKPRAPFGHQNFTIIRENTTR